MVLISTAELFADPAKASAAVQSKTEAWRTTSVPKGYPPEDPETQGHRVGSYCGQKYHFGEELHGKLPDGARLIAGTPCRYLTWKESLPGRRDRSPSQSSQTPRVLAREKERRGKQDAVRDDRAGLELGSGHADGPEIAKDRELTVDLRMMQTTTRHPTQRLSTPMAISKPPHGIEFADRRTLLSLVLRQALLARFNVIQFAAGLLGPKP
ncbi:hypothetical protein C8R44DRAFT_738870 [Mycena epipterygia]|nr:hypothetical protein C8R44DRAFT_738870 [Mycena epipterygia]